MNRFLVVTYSSDIGSDEGMDFSSFSDAVEEALLFKKTEEYAAIYDKITKTAYVIFGNPWIPVFSDRVTVIG